jgi:hypothetical protein
MATYQAENPLAKIVDAERHGGGWPWWLSPGADKADGSHVCEPESTRGVTKSLHSRPKPSHLKIQEGSRFTNA